MTIAIPNGCAVRVRYLECGGGAASADTALAVRGDEQPKRRVPAAAQIVDLRCTLY